MVANVATVAKPDDFVPISLPKIELRYFSKNLFTFLQLFDITYKEFM